MLTGKQVRVRFARDRIVPAYLDPEAPEWQEVAERLLEMFRSMSGQTRGEVEQEIADAFGDDPQQLIIDGLAKVLEDRCEFEVVAGKPPEELRERVFESYYRIPGTTGEGGGLGLAIVREIAAAHAACLSMALDHGLDQGGTPATRVETTASCTVEKVGDGFKITTMALKVRAKVPGIDQARFLKAAEAAKDGCPVSGALKGNVQFKLDAKLE